MPNPALRFFVAVLGICAVGWAISAMLAYRKDGALADTAKAILSGDHFGPDQLALMKRELDGATGDLNEASALGGAAVIRMFLLGDQLKSGDRQLSTVDYDRLQSSVGAALARAPTDSFIWLAAFWLRRLRYETSSSDVSLLRMSFWFAPNEAWIAIRRTPLALETFDSLPSDLRKETLREFAGLVQSGFYADAADILKGSGQPVRDQLAGALQTVNLADRRAFARTLDDKDIEDVTIPGVEDQHHRPF